MSYNHTIISSPDDKQNKKQKTLHTPDNIIDLTYDEVIIPLSLIKRDNKVFYSYDPRGVPYEDYLPLNYCNDCRCPKPYCANIMFTDMVYNHVMHLVLKNGSESYEDTDSICEEVSDVYTNLIHSKMMWNNIPFESCDKGTYLRLPACMAPNELVTKIEVDLNKQKEEDANLAWASTLEIEIDGIPKVTNHQASVVDKSVRMPLDNSSLTLENSIKSMSSKTRARMGVFDRLHPPDVGERFKRIREIVRRSSTTKK